MKPFILCPLGMKVLKQVGCHGAAEMCLWNELWDERVSASNWCAGNISAWVPVELLIGHFSFSTWRTCSETDENNAQLKNRGCASINVCQNNFMTHWFYFNCEQPYKVWSPDYYSINGLDCSIKLNDTPIKISVEDLHRVSSEDQNNFVSLKAEQRALGSSINR